MEWKAAMDFLRPTIAKLLLFVLLGGYFSTIHCSISSIASQNRWGMPFSFPSLNPPDYTIITANLIFWYLVSCAIILIKAKFLSKK